MSVNWPFEELAIGVKMSNFCLNESSRLVQNAPNLSFLDLAVTSIIGGPGMEGLGTTGSGVTAGGAHTPGRHVTVAHVAMAADVLAKGQVHGQQQGCALRPGGWRHAMHGEIG